LSVVQSELTDSTAALDNNLIEPFREGLRELGY
jgi:hypothetical protein